MRQLTLLFNFGTMQRYIRQMAFSGIGETGQKILGNSRVAIVGVGALGTVSANCLARAGVGFLRLIDKDCVERTNLHRQILYTEEDADNNVPKVVAACSLLARANSEIELEPVVAELNASNIEALLGDVDLVLDAVDHWETRFLVNRFCRNRSLPWIYCAALGAEGMTMNCMPDGPCLQCVVSPQTLGIQPTCVTEGVLNMATGAIASIQAAEGVKILLGSSHIRRGLLVADFWNNRFKTIPFEKDVRCSVCSG